MSSSRSKVPSGRMVGRLQERTNFKSEFQLFVRVRGAQMCPGKPSAATPRNRQRRVWGPVLRTRRRTGVGRCRVPFIGAHVRVSRTLCRSGYRPTRIPASRNSRLPLSTKTDAGRNGMLTAVRQIREGTSLMATHPNVRRGRLVRRRLITCSLCLRVHHGSQWLEAERVILQTRSYELAAPPRLAAALCDDCAATIVSRRG